MFRCCNGEKRTWGLSIPGVMSDRRPNLSPIQIPGAPDKIFITRAGSCVEVIVMPSPRTFSALRGLRSQHHPLLLRSESGLVVPQDSWLIEPGSRFIEMVPCMVHDLRPQHAIPAPLCHQIAQQALEEGFRGQIQPTLIQIAIPMEDSVILQLFLSLLQAKLGHVPGVTQSIFFGDFPFRTFAAVFPGVPSPLPMSPSRLLSPGSGRGSAPASPFSPAGPPTPATPVQTTPPPPSPIPLEGQVEVSGTGWFLAQNRIETIYPTGDAPRDLEVFAAASLENLFSPGPACPNPNPRVIGHDQGALSAYRAVSSQQVDVAIHVAFNGNDPVVWNPLALPDGAILHFPPRASSSPPPMGLVRPIPQFPDGERKPISPTAPPGCSGYIFGEATTDGHVFRVREIFAQLHRHALLLITLKKCFYPIPGNCPSVPARSPHPRVSPHPRGSPPPSAPPLPQLPLTPLLPLLIIALPAGTPVGVFDREVGNGFQAYADTGRIALLLLPLPPHRTTGRAAAPDAAPPS
ncbi:hypothetical protein PAPYR_8116 [Paratrimastix pyriformis]|uniref:Uncharacterized protein n=1 Tax=Paratrimastix pyriformis TaxID=342808 RepID=A0ABQ8UH39_9EUKA|nr:hypothetical protein PAPYR_8116 [Paratrimastix pyriformis]